MSLFTIDAFEFFDTKEFKKDMILNAHQYENLFEDAIKGLIQQLKEKLKQLEKEYEETSEKVINSSKESAGIPTDEDVEIFEDLGGIVQEQQWSQEQLYALNEMRAIYMFKSIEIEMKALIRTAYPKTNVKGFYHWDNMTAFFEEKGIKLDKLPGYKETIQLRKLNNNMKHSDIIDEVTKKIPEFSGNNLIEPQNFEAFFKRIEPEVKEFQNHISKEVVKELYEFDDKKLDELTTQFYERMDKKDAENFVKKLNRRFSINQKED